MKNNYECDVILDLLPLYLEHMTSEETRVVIQEHLEECENCRQEYLQMSASFTDIFAEKEEAKSRRWFKKKRRKPHYKRKTIVKLVIYAYAFLMLAIIVFCNFISPYVL